MRSSHRPLLAVLILAVAGCAAQAPLESADTSASGATSGEGLAAFREGLAALVLPPAETDLLRDQLIDAIDLGGALGDQADVILALVADAERAAYPDLPAMEIPTSGANPTAGVVSVAYFQLPPAAPPPTVEVKLVLHGVLAKVGYPGPTTARVGPATGSETAKGGGMTGKVTISMTGTATLTGSLVRLEIKRDTTWRVVEDANGAVVLGASGSHSVVAEFDVCPTVAGASLAGLDQVITIDVTTHAGASGRVGTHSTGSIDSSSDFRGQVDDSATLGNVTQDYTHEADWKRTAAAADGPEASREGAVDVAFTGINAGVPGQGSPSLSDFSEVDGSAQMSGDSTQEMINQTAVSAFFDYEAMAPAFVAAEELWRNSRCVMVAVPEYSAESELEVILQGFVDHTEDVESGSETPFEVAVQHRFGQAVSAGLEAELAGTDKLTPETLATPPGTLTYTAPDEDGQTATVRMTSTSKQGIGILAIAFDTGGVWGYEVTLVRETTGGPWDPTTLTMTAVLEPDAEGEDDGVLEGKGEAFGSLLEYDFASGSCKQSPYSGVGLFVAGLVGENLIIYPQLVDPFILEAGILSGEAPQSGGTTYQELAAVLAPGEQPPVGARCIDFSTITQSLTVRPLETEP